MTPAMNFLYYGDNLPVLWEHIIAIEELLDGKSIARPPAANVTFKQAPKMKGASAKQLSL